MKRFILILIYLCSSSLYAQTDQQLLLLQAMSADWKVGQVVATKTITPRNKYTANIERRFLGVTPEGYYKVQEFYIDIGAPFFYKKYPKNTPYTSAYNLINIEDVIRSQFYNDSPKQHKPSIQGSYILYDDNGKVDIAGQYDHGKKIGFWRYYLEDKIYSTKQYKEDRLIKTIDHHYYE
ncbi:hypothetical protein DM558_08850 [Entomomonas moraniae]|uniref:Uncharacterized protein n=1 Tax=Entomomonas moraniae TaxID=2213226 RepID=A0A3S9XEK3_9GAMM|nr:hypothetical protein [Entomomonas moraniae]AZS50883.1 hypothetical protein DM558_08850 [Entomomonas moraniae]